MSAELDLRGLHQHHEPDPAFVDALEQRLEAILSGTTGDDPASANGALIDLDLRARATWPARRRWIIRATLGAAAALVLVAVLGVIDRRGEGIVFAPSTTVAEPPTTAPTPAPPPNGPWVAYDFNTDVWIVRGDGTDPEGFPVEFLGGRGSLEACPAFTPDGRRLMLGRSPRGASDAAALVVFTVAADGSLSPLTTIPLDGIDDIGRIPCAIWAPDGRWAALGVGGAVLVVDTETGEVRRLPGYDPTDLEWRPGTDELAITGRALDRSRRTVPDSNFLGYNAPIDIYTVSSDEVRTIGDVEATELTWSPDGTTIAYTQAVPGAADMKSGITLIDADGTDQRRLTTADYVADHGIGVVWSPRGDQIAYQRERADCNETAPAPCYERSQVVLVSVTDTDPANPVGTERVIPPLTEDFYGPPNLYAEPWYADSVTWSPDGTQLLYHHAGILVAVPVDAAHPCRGCGPWPFPRTRARISEREPASR